MEKFKKPYLRQSKRLEIPQGNSDGESSKKVLSIANMKVEEEVVKAEANRNLNLFSDSNLSLQPEGSVSAVDSQSLYPPSIQETLKNYDDNSDADETFVYDTAKPFPDLNSSHHVHSSSKGNNALSTINSEQDSHEKPNLVHRPSFKNTIVGTHSVPGLGIENRVFSTAQPPLDNYRRHPSIARNSNAALLNSPHFRLSNKNSVIHHPITNNVDEDGSRYMFPRPQLLKRDSHPPPSNMLVSQVRNVSQHLFNSKRNKPAEDKHYMRKKISSSSLHKNAQEELYDDEFRIYSPRDASNFSYFSYGSDESLVEFPQQDPCAQQYPPLLLVPSHDNHYDTITRNSSFESPTYPVGGYYDYVSPHDYKSKNKFVLQNFILKLVSWLCQIFLLGLTVYLFSRLFVLKNMQNQLEGFQIVDLNRMIITENVITFDLTTRATNVNLQDVTIEYMDLDLFAQSSFIAESNSEKTVLLGNIQKFIVPIRFSGLLNYVMSRGENPKKTASKRWWLSDLWQLINHKDSVSESFSIGQMKLVDPGKYLRAQTEDWHDIIEMPFTLILRGKLKYSIPFQTSSQIVSVSESIWVNNDSL